MELPDFPEFNEIINTEIVAASTMLQSCSNNIDLETLSIGIIT
jgi:hypothetical protein